MISLQAFALTLALAGANPADPVLLEFHADWCGPCRSVAPTVQRLIDDGHPVRKVNVESDAALAAQFKIERVPTFVLVAGGQEVDRVVGAASYEQLRGLIAAHRPAVDAVAPIAATTFRGQSPDMPASSLAAMQARALQATVRLQVDDPNGTSYGTGTIIDMHGDEALAITCAHIFRDSQGRGAIQLDLFAAGNPQPRASVRGQLIHADMDLDIAFVSLRPGVAVTPMPVGGETFAVRQGDRVFSVGCDRGNPPTVRDSQITAINKYVGHANFEAAGAPVIGRSGGGLFSADGRLIGICNLADPEDDEGIYAALELVHKQLVAIGQPRLFRGDTQLAAVSPPPKMADRMPIAPLSVRNASPRTTAPTASAGQLTAVPEATAPTGLHRLANLLHEAGEDTEVICIVRSKRNPQRQSEVIVLDRPSRGLLDQLVSETGVPSPANPTVLQASRAGSPAAVPPMRNTTGAATANQILRGQSQR